MTKSCEYCRVSFQCRRKSDVYCGHKCARLSRNKKWREAHPKGQKVYPAVPCSVCGKPFTKKRKDAFQCSIACKNKLKWGKTKADPQRKLKAFEAARKSLKKRTDERWARIFAIHGDECGKCLTRLPRCCYDLHHVKLGLKRSKRENSAVVMRQGTDAEFEAMLSVTQLVCANCHRIIHDNGKPYGK